MSKYDVYQTQNLQLVRLIRQESNPISGGIFDATAFAEDLYLEIQRNRVVA
jgi:hypothetical protein